MQETRVPSLGRENPLEKEMATHSSILAWRIPWTEEPGGLQSTGLQRVGHNWATSLSLSFFPLTSSIGITSEKAVAPHSSTLAWKIPWTEEPGRLQSMGSLSRARLSDFTFTFHFHALEKEMATHSSVLAPGNPRDGGAWWAAVYGVAQSRTLLKRLGSSSSRSLLERQKSRPYCKSIESESIF